MEVENVIRSFEKCDISKAMDGTKDILYNSNNKVKVDSTGPDWNPYNDGTWDESCDMYEKPLETDSDGCKEFDGF